MRCFRTCTSWRGLGALLACSLAILPRVSPAPASKLMPGPYPEIFKTEPTFIPSVIDVIDTTNDSSLLEPGYYFIAPHIGMRGYGPQILDQDANLIWYGNEMAHSAYAGDFAVCDFKGESGSHLCWSENNGTNRILDAAYELAVRDFESFGSLPKPDVHEFNILPGGETFVTVVYKHRPMDLRAYGGPKNGFVADGCLQEVDIRRRKEIFHWCFLDHYEVHETFLYLNIEANKVNSSSSTSGKGNAHSPWDFMHINAVDKNSEGDYLVSGRHLSQILKIAGPNNAHGVKPGTTIWRLNGQHSDFTFPDENAKFGRQHHCRFIHTGATETVISLFNNAYDNALNTTKEQSEGLILRLNNETMEARIEGRYPNPKKHRSAAQGSMSVTPVKGNAVIGWGTYPEWSEFSPNGTLLFHAEAYANSLKTLSQYRVFKFPWVGRPRTKPKVVAYCQTCQAFPSNSKSSSPMVAYVSWNGATEVKSWRFHLSATTKIGPWFPAGTFPKYGFETKAVLSSMALDRLAKFAPWVSVEALSANGSVLATVVSRTFVPSPKIKKIQGECGPDGCFNPQRFVYADKFNASSSCNVNWATLVIVAILVALSIETFDRVLTGLVECSVAIGCKESGEESDGEFPEKIDDTLTSLAPLITNER